MAKRKGNKKSKHQQAQEPQRAAQQEQRQPAASVEVHEGLTNTNTDKTCLDTKKPFFFRWLYQYNLWTGLYMLNPSERAGFNFFGWLFSMCTLVYLYVFLNGLRDGFSTPLDVME